MSDEPDIDDVDSCDPEHIFTCWCGAQGTYDELFGSDSLDYGCGGTGTLNCYCGGDFCVCHLHGEVECPGCEDCCDDYENDYTEDFDDDFPDDDRP